MSFVSLNYINYPNQTMVKRWTEEIFSNIAHAIMRVSWVFFVDFVYIYTFECLWVEMRETKTMTTTMKIHRLLVPMFFFTKQIWNQIMQFEECKEISQKYKDLIYFISILSLIFGIVYVFWFGCFFYISRSNICTESYWFQSNFVIHFTLCDFFFLD